MQKLRMQRARGISCLEVPPRKDHMPQPSIRSLYIMERHRHWMPGSPIYGNRREICPPLVVSTLRTQLWQRGNGAAMVSMVHIRPLTYMVSSFTFVCDPTKLMSILLEYTWDGTKYAIPWVTSRLDIKSLFLEVRSRTIQIGPVKRIIMMYDPAIYPIHATLTCP